MMPMYMTVFLVVSLLYWTVVGIPAPPPKEERRLKKRLPAIRATRVREKELGLERWEFGVSAKETDLIEQLLRESEPKVPLPTSPSNEAIIKTRTYGCTPENPCGEHRKPLMVEVDPDQFRERSPSEILHLQGGCDCDSECY